ncbi:MAG: MFS transporter [Planctomycetes bacterium]|nr:MFS transporter [Planctomycetota bacterium]
MARLFRIRRGEWTVTLWSFAYAFFLLSGYYVLRPVREAMGIAGDLRALSWLFTATFVTMLGAMPVYWALVMRYPRRIFIPAVYHFFTLNLLAFAGVLALWPGAEGAVGRVYFVWVSVFNLMVISVFWSFMADTFTNEQGRRLFGFIAGGGTIGALVGALATAQLVERLGIATLLLLSAALLQGAVYCQRRVARSAATGRPPHEALARERQRIGGGLLTGFLAVLRSPYLLAICGYIFLDTYAGTVLYFAQATVVQEAAMGTEVRTRLFAYIEVAVQALTLLMQFFLAERAMRRIGVGLTLAVLPAIFAVGFAGLGAAPVLATVVVFQVVRRSTHYGLSKPTRETLFTLVSDEEKYKSKGFIDTVVYRGGDAVSARLFDGLRGLGHGLGTIALLSIPASAVWIALALFLGRKQRARRRAAGERG